MNSPVFYLITSYIPPTCIKGQSLLYILAYQDNQDMVRRYLGTPDSGISLKKDNLSETSYHCDLLMKDS